MTTGVIVLVLINAWTFLLMLLDKHAAKRHSARIPERILLFFSFIGGSLGATAAMLLCNHKTKQYRFLVGLPVLLLIHLGLLLSIFML